MSGIRRRLLYAKPKEIIVERDYLCFTALESGEFTLTIDQYVTTTELQSVSYSINGGKTWVTTNNEDNTAITITTPTISVDGKVLWKGNGITTAHSYANNSKSSFSSTCRFNVSGNVLSMLYGDEFENYDSMDSSANGLNQLFVDCTTLIDASDLNLSWDCVERCYYRMFYGCTNLVTPPKLNSMTLANYCYYEMFRGCISLTTIPELPATVLVPLCYGAMFYGCTSLTTIPVKLSASELAQRCYYNMFFGCTSLTESPELTSLTLATQSNQRMFYNCSSLSYITMLATDISATNCLATWVTNVASTGIFVKHINAQWNVVGVAGVPEGWTIIYYDPALDKYYLDQQRNEECDKYGNYKAVEATTNPEAMAVIYAQGWSASTDYMTFSEASAVTDIGTYFRNAGMTHFMEFIHFTSVTTIKTNAFSGNNLTSLAIPPSVTTIERFGVYYQPLQYLYFPSSIVNYTASANFTNNSSVQFELHVDSLESYAVLDFGERMFMVDANNPDYYFYVGDNVLNSAVVLPNITKIGSYTFSGYNKISSITIPNSVLTIGEKAFFNARHGYTNFIDIGSGVTSIGNQAFADVRSCPTLICRAMTAPTLGTNVFQTWGYNIPTAERKLIVPIGAVGYDTDQWKTVLQDQRGYQLIYSDEL